MKQTLSTVFFAMLFLGLLIYLLGSFVAGSFEPSEWSVGFRALCAMCFAIIVVNIIGDALDSLDEEDEEIYDAPVAATTFLKKKGLIKDGFQKFIITHPEVGEVDLGQLLTEWGTHVVSQYEAMNDEEKIW